MKDSLKKNWKNILIVLLVLFSLNKCTQSCSRGSEINKLTTQIEKSDSIYTEQNKTLILERDSFKHALDIAKSENEALNKMNSTLTDVAKKETKVQVVRTK